MTVTQLFLGEPAKTGPSQSEKDAWTNARLQEVANGTYKGKEPSAGFEPLEGWKPFAQYGESPAEIIANAMNANDRSALFVGDYIKFRISNDMAEPPCRFTIKAFDQYLTNDQEGEPYHHALMVSDYAMQAMAWDSTGETDYSASALSLWLDGTFISRFPQTVINNALPMAIPYWDADGEAYRASVQVFTLSEVEYYGDVVVSTDQRVEPGGENEPNHPVPGVSYLKPIFGLIEGNYAPSWWLRSMSSSGDPVGVMNNMDGMPQASPATEERYVVPCFCLG